MSMSARKRRNRKENFRQGWKRYRANEKAAIRGDHVRGTHYSERYTHMGDLKGSTLPLD